MQFGNNPLSPGGHGSCMLSKIAGKTLGSAKKITPILTRIDPATAYFEDFLDGLQMIYDHVIANGNKGKAVINMSLNFKTSDVPQGWVNRFGKLSIYSTQ